MYQVDWPRSRSKSRQSLERTPSSFTWVTCGQTDGLRRDQSRPAVSRASQTGNSVTERVAQLLPVRSSGVREVENLNLKSGGLTNLKAPLKIDRHSWLIWRLDANSSPEFLGSLFHCGNFAGRTLYRTVYRIGFINVVLLVEVIEALTIEAQTC